MSTSCPVWPSDETCTYNPKVFLTRDPCMYNCTIVSSLSHHHHHHHHHPHHPNHPHHRYVAAVVRPAATFDPNAHPSSSHPLYPMSPAAMQVFVIKMTMMKMRTMMTMMTMTMTWQGMPLTAAWPGFPPYPPTSAAHHHYPRLVIFNLKYFKTSSKN